MSAPLVRGLRVDAVVEKGVFRGRGLARVEGQVLFVPRAHPGERVRVEVTEVHGGWAEGRLLEVLAPSPDRRPSPCRYSPACGGCSYQDLGYEAQVALKEAILRESLARAGAPWDGPVSVHRSPERGWRTRASLHFAPGDGGPRLGLRREGSRRLVELDECLQLSDRMNEAARSIRDALGSHPALWPRARGLDLLEPPAGGPVVALLETALAPHEASAVQALVPAARGLAGLGVAAGRRTYWLAGSPFVHALVGGVRLRAHVRSFFQANRFLLEPLAGTVLDLVSPGGGGVVDLYAGVGLFAAPLAARAEAEVVAVEWSASAAEDARWGGRENGLPGLRVVEADAARALASLPSREGETIVLDPPRAGAGPEVVALVAGRRPREVVYVSCDPATLGRDLAQLARAGYRPDAVHMFDQFPDTFHLEAVVRLRPA